MTIATPFISINLKIAQKLCPVPLVIFIQRTPPGPFDTEPDSIAIHHPAHAGERQPVIAQRLPVTRSDDIDRLRRLRQDFINSFARLAFNQWWEVR